MKIIVYSANIGGYDLFHNPEVVDENVRYILFTDNKYFKSDIWEVNHIDFLPDDLDNRLKARYLKVNPHIVLPNHDVNIWVDHTFTIKVHNFEKLLKDNDFENISIYKHRHRDCIYDEGKQVIHAKKEYPDVVHKQLKKYSDEGFPTKYGLYETGGMIRRNNNKNKLFGNIWWSEIKKGSGRDQLSHMYTSWKTGTKIKPFKFGVSQYDNPYWFYHHHMKNYQAK